MTFLQPWVLLALPLVALPLVIHLINQRRFQTMPWGAMMFLLSARALSRGYSRLRHWLIMALRMLAVAAVILAVGRPLSRGWLALAGGGRPDTAIVILDRSPSMQARGLAAAETKLATGRRQLAESLTTLGATRLVVLTDPARPPLELARPELLEELPAAGPAAAPADMPRLLQAAYDHVRDTAAGATEIWICSDQRANDWDPGSGSWAGLREAFARLPQPVRFQLVSFSAPADRNVAIRVISCRLEYRASPLQGTSASPLQGTSASPLQGTSASPPTGRPGARPTVVLSLAARVGGEAAAGTTPRQRLPVTIDIGGVATTVEMELDGPESVLADHAVPLASFEGPVGWGTVSIPADANAADNEFFFTFAEPPPRRTIVVSDDAAAARILALIAEIPPDRLQEATVDIVSPEAAAGAPWSEAAALLWQAPLPTGPAASAVEAFVARGGQVVFFPPAIPDSTTFAGLGWTAWTDHPEPIVPATWRTDQDVLANTLSGAALPVGDLAIRRSCGISGEAATREGTAAEGAAGLPLASLPGGEMLLARSVAGDRHAPGAALPQGGVLFCATTPLGRDSSLASEGVVLYSLVQRSIDRGLEVLSRARLVDAGGPDAPSASAERIAGTGRGVPAEQAGVYAVADGLVAVNRPAAEDAAAIEPDARIDDLFGGLSFARISGTAGSTDSLVQEIWRAFLIAMVLALIAEGLLSLPSRRDDRPRPAARPAGFGGPAEAAA
jgi:hypothetical protein